MSADLGPQRKTAIRVDDPSVELRHGRILARSPRFPSIVLARACRATCGSAGNKNLPRPAGPRRSVTLVRDARAGSCARRDFDPRPRNGTPWSTGTTRSWSTASWPRWSGRAAWARGTGWLPRFILVRWRGELVGAAPAYLKSHSYGEFVFDWGWAAAAERAGLAYYPKLVAAVPFTPGDGQPAAGAPRRRRRRPCAQALVDGLDALAEEHRRSSIHVLFCTESEKRPAGRRAGSPRGWACSSTGATGRRCPTRLRRLPGRVSLAQPQAGAPRTGGRRRPRPAARDPRRARAGASATGRRCSTSTRPTSTNTAASATCRRGFFEEIRQRFAHRVVATLASRGDEVVAGHPQLRAGAAPLRPLLGRPGGARDAALRAVLLPAHRAGDRRAVRTCFEAGAQGEHKLKRGLDPALTHSAHLIRHPGLGSAVARFVAGEAEHVATRAGLLQVAVALLRAAGAPSLPAGPPGWAPTVRSSRDASG